MRGRQLQTFEVHGWVNDGQPIVGIKGPGVKLAIDPVSALTLAQRLMECAFLLGVMPNLMDLAQRYEIPAGEVERAIAKAMVE